MTGQDPKSAAAGRDDVSIARTAGTATAARAGRQAVVLIHGMGEQIPMDTIKGFVRTAWELDGSLADKSFPDPNRVWSKPDERSGSLELRRITTRESVAGGSFPAGVRTDFYELYWADLTGGSTWQQFTAWVRYLLFRRWGMVPLRLRSAWIALWVATLAVVGLGLIGLVPKEWWDAWMPTWLPQKLLLPIAAAALAGLHVAASRSFGRVVRYTRAEPDNIAARKAVRDRGLALLRAVHADGLYERVVVVGHSLGTILAHDLVSYFWAEQTLARTIAADSASFVALAEVEQAAAALDADASPANLARFRRAQGSFGLALREASQDAADKGGRWLISDLVTFGSPLAHAEVLLAKGRGDLDDRTAARELPTSPPYREALDAEVLAAAVATNALPIAVDPTHSKLMSFPANGEAKSWVVHYAAPFAAVRWSNVHDPARWIARGDLISGPLAPVFGRGIVDVDLSSIDAPSGRFTHTRYWAEDQPEARVRAFRSALNLLDRPDPGAETAAKEVGQTA